MLYNTAKILFLILIFNIMSNNILSQNKNIAIIGKVINSETRKPIPFAHLINFSTARGTISDTIGTFKLKLDTGNNSIKISSIGYYTKTIYLNTENIKVPYVIELKERIYQILQVEVYPFTKKEFKHDFVYKEIPKDTIALIEDVMKTRWNSVEVLRGLTPTRQIPLNFKTNIERQEILLAKIKEYSALKTSNLALMKQITNFEGKKLYDFDRYCKFSYNFLKNAPEYYIYIKITEKFEEFKKLPPAKEIIFD
jgi:hypothetical protein